MLLSSDFRLDHPLINDSHECGICLATHRCFMFTTGEKVTKANQQKTKIDKILFCMACRHLPIMFIPYVHQPSVLCLYDLLRLIR